MNGLPLLCNAIKRAIGLQINMVRLFEAVFLCAIARLGRARHTLHVSCQSRLPPGYFFCSQRKSMPITGLSSNGPSDWMTKTALPLGSSRSRVETVRDKVR